MNTQKLQAILSYYARALVIVEIPIALTGTTHWQAYALGAAAAVLGPVIEAIDPNNPQFGRLAKQVTDKLTQAEQAAQ